MTDHPSVSTKTVADVANDLEALFKKIELWPETTEQSFLDLLSLRNAIPEAVAALRTALEPRGRWHPSLIRGLRAAAAEGYQICGAAADALETLQPPALTPEPMPEPPELTGYPERQLDAVDASMFSGDCYAEAAGRARLRWYIQRWTRLMDAQDAAEQSETKAGNV